MIQILFAILAGVLTIGAPCILPLLPILLGSSVGHSSKTRPLFIVGGFVLVFSVLGIFLSFLTTHLGIDPNTLRIIAIFCLGIFGLLMIWPKPFELLTMYMNGAINKANQIGNSQSGNFGGFLLGMMLGIIWTPCAGPVLGTILTLIATQGNTFRSILLLIAYAVGAGIPMLVIAYGSQYITTKVRAVAQYSARLQQIFGVLVLLLAVAMYFQYDTLIQNKLTQYFPSTTSLEAQLTGGADDKQPAKTATNNSEKTMEKIELKNLGTAPNFAGISHWINSDPLTISQLKSKVVLVDFWTYSCINCIRTLPYVTKWYDTYKDKGFVVVGVHTPEFAFEKVTDNVKTAMQRFGINYPVAQDNDYGTWSAYNNQYWPAEYLIDQNGNIVYSHFGEGNYDHTENAIRQLLGLDTENPPAGGGQDLSLVNSPEMYFEQSRLQYLSSDQSPSPDPKLYTLASSLALNNFALEGQWKFNNDNAELVTGPGKIRLHFSSGKVFMVASSAKPITIHISVDGIKQPDVTVNMSQLYTLFDSSIYAEHTVDIDIPDSGFQAFTFTFG